MLVFWNVLLSNHPNLIVYYAHMSLIRRIELLVVTSPSQLS